MCLFHSSSHILWISCLRNVLFFCVGKEMAENNASLGIDWIKNAKISHSNRKEKIGSPHQNARMCCAYKFFGWQKNHFWYVSKYILFFFLTFSSVDFAVEHILNLISIIHFTTTCLDPEEPIKEFFKIQLSQLFTFVPYSPLFALLGKIVNISSTFCWNFMDLHVMMVSLGLSTRFKQINQELRRVKGQVS